MQANSNTNASAASRASNLLQTQQTSSASGSNSMTWMLPLGLILTLQLVERYAFHSVQVALFPYLTDVMKQPPDYVDSLRFTITFLAYNVPLAAALIADAWLGRFRVIVLGCLLHIASLAFLFTTFLYPAVGGPLLNISALWGVAIAAGIFVPTAAAFGADQISQSTGGSMNTKICSYFAAALFCWRLGELASWAVVGSWLGTSVQSCSGLLGCLPGAFGLPVIALVLVMVGLLFSPSLFVHTPSLTFCSLVNTLLCCCASNKQTVMTQNQIGDHSCEHDKRCAAMIADADSNYFISDERGSDANGSPQQHLPRCFQLEYIVGLRSLGKNILLAVVLAPVGALLAALFLYEPLWGQQAGGWMRDWEAPMLGGFITLTPASMPMAKLLLVLALVPTLHYWVYPWLASRKRSSCLPSRNYLHCPMRRMVAGFLLAGVAFAISAALQFSVESSNSQLGMRQPHDEQPAESFISVINAFPTNCTIFVSGMPCQQQQQSGGKTTTARKTIRWPGARPASPTSVTPLVSHSDPAVNMAEAFRVDMTMVAKANANSAKDTRNIGATGMLLDSMRVDFEGECAGHQSLSAAYKPSVVAGMWTYVVLSPHGVFSNSIRWQQQRPSFSPSVSSPPGSSAPASSLLLVNVALPCGVVQLQGQQQQGQVGSASGGGVMGRDECPNDSVAQALAPLTFDLALCPCNTKAACCAAGNRTEVRWSGMRSNAGGEAVQMETLGAFAPSGDTLGAGSFLVYDFKPITRSGNYRLVLTETFSTTNNNTSSNIAGAAETTSNGGNSPLQIVSGLFHLDSAGGVYMLSVSLSTSPLALQPPPLTVSPLSSIPLLHQQLPPLLTDLYTIAAPRAAWAVVWQLPQYALLATAEVVVMVAGWELCYVETADSLRTLSLALWLFTVGGGGYLATWMVGPLSQACLTTALVIVSAVLFLFSAIQLWIASRVYRPYAVMLAEANRERLFAAAAARQRGEHQAGKARHSNTSSTSNTRGLHLHTQQQQLNLASAAIVEDGRLVLRVGGKEEAVAIQSEEGTTISTLSRLSERVEHMRTQRYSTNMANIQK